MNLGRLKLTKSVAWLFTTVCLGQSLQEQIEKIVSQEMSRQNIPGVSVAVAANNKLVYSRGFGLADLENDVPVKTGSVFRLASISKPLTATAIMQLAEQKRIDLDVPVQRYCPTFPPKEWPITVRQLLSHTAGIRHYREGPDEDFNSTRHFGSIVDGLAIFAGDNLRFEPGTDWLYSTYGYSVLGCAIEGASREPYETYLRKHVLEPSGMAATRVDDAQELVAQRARGYSKAVDGSARNAAFSDTSNKVPGGGWCSTAEDPVRFAIALNSGILLSATSREELFTEVKTRAGKATGYGLGWFLLKRGEDRVVRHGGASQGTTTGLYLIPARGYAFALLTNMENVNTFQIDQQIAKLVLQQ